MRQQLYPFYQSLKARRFSVKALATLVGTSESHLYATFAGQRPTTRATRQRLMIWLADSEVKILGWDPSQRPKVSGDIKFYVEQK